MVWEGKIEQHKFACLTENQKKVLDGANKRLRILTPATKKKEKTLRAKHIEQLKTIREEMGITESAERTKESREEYEAIVADQNNREHQGRKKQTVKRPVKPIEPISVRIEKRVI